MPTFKERQMEVAAMLTYLDEHEVLIQSEEVKRRRDGKQAFRVTLMGAPEFYGSTKTIHTYLTGVCDGLSWQLGTVNPRTGQ